MKVIIEGRLHTSAALLKDALSEADEEGMVGDTYDVKIEVVGSPDEELERGQIPLIHPKVSIELSFDELQRALRVFEER